MDVRARGRKGLDLRAPDRRAVVGGALVAAALAVAWLSLPRPARPPLRSVVVAARPVVAGHRLTAGDVAERRVRLPEGLAPLATLQRDRAIGAVATGPLAPGDVVQPSDVDTDRRRARTWEVPLVVDDAWLPGEGVAAGDVVDVLATEGQGPEARTRLVLAGATVSSVARPGRSLVGSGEASLTVVAPDRQAALRLTTAARAGTITLVRG